MIRGVHMVDPPTCAKWSRSQECNVAMYILWFSEAKRQNCCKLKIGQSNLYVQKSNQNLADCNIFIIYYSLGI